MLNRLEGGLCILGPCHFYLNPCLLYNMLVVISIFHQMQSWAGKLSHIQYFEKTMYNQCASVSYFGISILLSSKKITPKNFHCDLCIFFISSIITFNCLSTIQLSDIIRVLIWLVLSPNRFPFSKCWSKSRLIKTFFINHIGTKNRKRLLLTPSNCFAKIVTVTWARQIYCLTRPWKYIHWYNHFILEC